MIPLVFSGNRGWLHLPEENLLKKEGVVFFPAYGVEDLATRHSLALLADRLAAAGHPVLRFDPPGCGDSLGNWDDTATLPAWIDAGEQAVETLRQASGATSTGLLGLRLGGLVACLLAERLQAAGQPPSSLTLLAPVLDGRQHMREWRALSAGASPLTIAGFPISEALRQAVAGITPGQFATPPAPRIFLGIPGTARYLSELETQWRQSADLHAEPYPELAEHIGNPTMSRAPAEMFSRLLAWFGEAPPSQPTGQPKTPECALPASLTGDCFVEQGELLAGANGLAGIWCSPSRKAARAIVVFCNAGRNPHIGWARSSVSHARRLAGHGIASLRFDLAGLGDSPPPAEQPAELLYSKVGIPQLRAALDAVEARFGETVPVCLLGACSGGYLAFHEAVDDARVSALVLVNVQRFIWQEGTSLQASMRTAGKSTQAYRQRAFAWATWKRILGGKVDIGAVAGTLWQRAWRSLTETGQEWVTNVIAGKPAPETTSTIRQGFAKLVCRGTQTRVIYGEEDGGRDEFARYFGSDGRGFSGLPGARLLIIPETDHDLTPLAARERLFSEILGACLPEAGKQVFRRS